MHVLYLIQYFGTPADPATSDRAFDFVSHFAQTGHNVTLITSDAFITDSAHLNEHLPSGVQTKLITQPYHNSLSKTGRIYAFVLFWVKAFIQALNLKAPPDVIYASSTPLSVPILGAVLAKLWRIPWIFEIRDLWPDFIFDVGAIQNPAIKSILYHTEHLLYKSTSLIISLSPTTTSILINQKSIPDTNILTLPNGCPYPYPSPQKSKKDLVGANRYKQPLVLYAGTLGFANDVDWLLACCDQLLRTSDITIAILGEGAEKSKLSVWYRALKPSKRKRVITMDFIARDAVQDWFWAADFSLITFRDLPSLKATSPNKYFHTLATHTIPVSNHPGWISEEITSQHIGITTDNALEAAHEIKKWIQHPNRIVQAQKNMEKLVQEYRRDHMAQILLQSIANILP